MRHLLILLIFLSGIAVQKSHADWFCCEGASGQYRNTIESSEIVTADSEDAARKSALENTFAEFNKICDKSDTCNGCEKAVEPTRTGCVQNAGRFTCYRR